MRRSSMALLVIGLFLPVVFAFRRWLLAFFLKLPCPRYRIGLQRGIRVPMADGVHLTTDHYSPIKNGNYPTILIRSPYGRNAHASSMGITLEFAARRFAERGYHVIVQDVRGRFDSGGVFDPYFNERADGQATVAWLKRQPWFNGQVGMWGSSYLGLVQWALMLDTPELKAVNLAVTSSSLHTVLFPDGAFDLGLAMRWMALLEELEQVKDRPFWHSLLLWGRIEDRVKVALETLPLSDCDQKTVGRAVDFYHNWLTHNDITDELWQTAITELETHEITAAVHMVGGWYDFFLRGLLLDYERLIRQGKQPYLTIGPWSHFNLLVSGADLREGITWCDAILKGKTERLRASPVRVYVLGAERWRDFPTWPPPNPVISYYLQPERELSPAMPTIAESFDGYVYDPLQPTPAPGGAIFSMYHAGKRDNRQLEARDDVLTFSTAPLTAPLEVIGYVRLRLYVCSSVTHTDFLGRLCDVTPDGKSYNVCDGLFRVVPGKGEEQADGTLLVEVDMWATAYQFKAGHRLRVQVASGAHPRWARNLGTDAPFAQGVDARIAEQKVYHDAAHPSALMLPVYAR